MKVELNHALENATDLFGVGYEVGGSDEEIIHIDDKPPFSDHVSEQVIHELLECSRGIKKAKEHDGRFKESFVYDKSHLPLVAIFDADIVVPSVNIKFGKMTSVFQLVNKVGDERRGVFIMGSVFIKIHSSRLSKGKFCYPFF